MLAVLSLTLIKRENDFRYLKEEVIGKQVEVLLPRSLEPKRTLPCWFYKHPSPQAVGAGRDLFARRKDGSVLPVELPHI